MNVKYRLSFLLMLMTNSALCVYSETIDLHITEISSVQSLKSIAQELPNADDDTLSYYTIQPMCMAAYIRHRENIDPFPTQQEVDVFEQQKDSPNYRNLTNAILREVNAEKMGTIEHLHGAMHFYAKKEEDRRVSLIATTVKTKKGFYCIIPTCIGFTVALVGIFAGIYTGIALLPPCPRY